MLSREERKFPEQKGESVEARGLQTPHCTFKPVSAPVLPDWAVNLA